MKNAVNRTLWVKKNIRLLTLFLFSILSSTMMAETIFSFTVTRDKTGVGTYNAVGGTAECTRAMAVDGTNEVTIGSQTFYKFNSSTEWIFTLAGNTLAAGDVITFTCACNENKNGKGLIANNLVLTNDFTQGSSNTLTHTVEAGDAFIGKTVISVKRNDADIKFGTIEITRGESSGTDPDPGTDPGTDPLPSNNLHFWFFHSTDATTNGVTNDAAVFSNMITAGSNKSGTLTIDGQNYTVTKRTGDNATFGNFTIPEGKTATFYALAISSGSGDRQINLVNGSTRFELTVEGGDAFKQIEQTNIPAGTYSIEREGSNNVRLGVVALKFIGGDDPTPTVSSVTVSPSSATLDINDTQQLNATVNATPATADKTVTWSTSDANVATVSSTGLVTAIAQGTATITATSNLDNTKTGTCTITVNAPATQVEVESISIKTITTISVGSSETLTVTYTPADANTGKAITWTSADQNIATVDNSGKVTGIAVGSTTITATSENGKTATCTVTVKAVAVTGVSLNKTTLTLKENGTETLTATVSPSDAADKSVTWTSSNSNVATVDANGKVTAIAEGTATITVTTTDQGKTATCTVTVEAKSQSGLTTHTPEIYEETPANDGWGGTLTNYGGRDYEVFYFTKSNSAIAVGLTQLATINIATGSSANAFSVKGNWMKGSGLDVEGSTSSGSSKKADGIDEIQDSYGSLKMGVGAEFSLQVKGYDQFSIIAQDNNITPNDGKPRWLRIYIDDVEVTKDIAKESPTMRRYDISSAEHHIVIKSEYNTSKTYAFSLRVSNDPIVRHVGGPKEQTVYQTKDIQRVTYRVRRAASHRLSWIDNAIPGVQLVNGTNDSVFVEGIADAAVGVYTYKIEALDAAGSVASSETGKITISTHISDAAKGNDFSTNIAEEIKPLNFIYYATNSSDIQLNCDIEGLSLSFSKDSIATLSGTPAITTTEGEHTYTITATGGNTITGKITIVVPDPYFEPIAEVKGKDGQPLSFSIFARHAANVTVTGLPSGLTVNYDATTDIATISGTPNVGSPYPKSFDYTATATPRYEGKSSSTTTGKITIVDPNAKPILVVCKGLSDVSEEPVAAYLQSRYDITLRQQEELAGSSFEAFDLIIISESVDADNEEVINIIRPGVNRPVLNLKGFTYASNRLDWGNPDNGAIDSTAAKNKGCKLYIQQPTHPVFARFNNLKYGDSLAILSNYVRNGIMPIEVTSPGTICLATGYTRNIDDYYGYGVQQTAIHEVPTSMSGRQKYICLSMARNVTLNENGKKLIDGIIDYLNSSKEFEYDAPSMEIERFTLLGETVTPNQSENTIFISLPQEKYDELATAEPVIELSDPYAHVETNKTSLQFAIYVPKVYVVSDYISRRAYNLTIDLYDPQGIDEVYEAGMWVNIYDIYGRMVTTTNQNIYTMDLPQGMYIVVTENGHSMKIMR